VRSLNGGLKGDVVNFGRVLFLHYRSFIGGAVPKAGRLPYLLRQLLKTSFRVTKFALGVLCSPSLKSGLR
jgi:hypothetical protein